MTTDRHTYWVSIGRNTNDGGQLHTGNWLAFRASVNSVLAGFGETITTVDGVSDWQGQAEETYLVLAEIHPDAVGDVRSALGYLARDFSQDAIGFVGGAGTDTLIKP